MEVQKEVECSGHSAHSSIQHVTEHVKSSPGLVQCVRAQMHVFKDLKIVFQRNNYICKELALCA